jgi:hypothetical protein
MVAGQKVRYNMDMRGRLGERAQKVRLSSGFMHYGPPRSTQVRPGRAQADPEALRLALMELGVATTAGSTQDSSEERSVHRLAYIDDADNLRLLKAATGRRRRSRHKVDLRCAGQDEYGKRICVCGKAELTEDCKTMGPESPKDFRPHQAHTVKMIYRIGTASDGKVWHRQGPLD